MTSLNKKLATFGLGVMLAFGALSGCTEASKVNHNLRLEADNFNIQRRITVFNLRTDTVLFEMAGLISISNDEDGDLNVTVQTGENTFRQHYIHMSDETVYVVEDVGRPTETDKYRYDINFLPEWGLRVTTHE